MPQLQYKFCQNIPTFVQLFVHFFSDLSIYYNIMHDVVSFFSKRTCTYISISCLICYISTETNLLYTRPSSHRKMVKVNVGAATRKVCFSMFMRSTACHWTSGFCTEVGLSIQSSPAY